MITSVMLNQFSCSNVPNFHARIRAASANASATWMKGNFVQKPVRFVERMHAFIGISIPDFNGFIVATADDEPTVGREFRTTNPVRMLIERELKFLTVYCPDFNCFVFR